MIEISQSFPGIGRALLTKREPDAPWNQGRPGAWFRPASRPPAAAEFFSLRGEAGGRSGAVGGRRTAHGPQALGDVAGTWRRRLRKKMAPREGFEPPTNRLTAGCSTAELSENKFLFIFISI